MKSAYTKIYRLIWIVVFVDMVTINIVFLLYCILDKLKEFDPVLFKYCFKYWLASNLAYLIAINVVKISVHRRITKPDMVLRNVSRTIPLTFLLFMTIIGIAKLPTPGVAKSLIICIIAFVVISIERITMRMFIKKIRNLGRNSLNSIIIGYGPSANPLIDLMNNKWNGLNLIGIFTDKNIDGQNVKATRIGSVDCAIEYINQHELHDVFIYRPLRKDSRIKNLLNACYKNVARVYYIPQDDIAENSDVFPFKVGDTYILATRHEPLLRFKNQVYKRGFDIVVSLLFLCTFYPFLYIVVAIITKLTNPGPVYFKQERTGYDGRSFVCYKFRSMKINKDADKKQATENDNRVTKFGHFIRHYNIDEFPQFINVLKGDMSIVGPRPHMLAHTEYYSELIGEYMIRHFVRPGITGLAQVSGCRGETKTVEDMKERVEKDLEYIENWSFWQDIVIILRTVSQAVGGDKQAY